MGLGEGRERKGKEVREERRRWLGECRERQRKKKKKGHKRRRKGRS